MLLKINNRIINTAHIIEAKLSGTGTKSHLVLHMVSDGTRTDAPNVSPCVIILADKEARGVWQALSKEAQEINPALVF
jgi:hypothetical protein